MGEWVGERKRETVKERERKRERKRERERERGVREQEKTDVPKLYAYNECEHSVASNENNFLHCKISIT